MKLRLSFSVSDVDVSSAHWVSLALIAGMSKCVSDQEFNKLMISVFIAIQNPRF